jgi:hypothetical protein
MNVKRWMAILGAILAMGTVTSADAGLFGLGGTSWKEEVLLHDGGKIIVERSQNYRGRHEIGQSPPVKEHAIKFTLPDSSKTIKWESEYGEDIGRTNFNLLALHVLNGVPYLVAEPNLCLSYNKWGRPNPPYVIFKFDGNAWQQVQMAALPSEFKAINLIVNNGREEDIKKAANQLGYVSAEGVHAINSSLRQPEYQTILREAIISAGGRCGEMVFDGNGGWIGIGWFRKQPSVEACIKFCDQKSIGAEFCPCNSIFQSKAQIK